MKKYISQFFKWLSSLFEVSAIPITNESAVKVETKVEEKVEIPQPPETIKEETKPETKKESEDEFNIYKPKERLIYSYWNGKELVKADPMTLYKKVMNVGPELAIHFKVAKSQSSGAKDAHDSLIKEVRNIFGVKSLEEEPEGLPQLETMELLNHFLAFINRIKKNSRTLPTTSKHSEDSIPTSEDENPPISNSSDSGSTEDAP